MFSNKEKKILQILVEEKENFVTSKKLAAHLSCSDRTIRNHLKCISTELEFIEGVNLCSKQGHGYKLFFRDQNKKQSFIQMYDLVNHTIQNDSDVEERYTVILNKLLFEHESILFDDLADELYVSRSNLSHDFKIIRKMLDEYNLKIESRANKGVLILGKESDKRRFIMNYFLGSQFLKTVQRHIKMDVLDQNLNLESLTRIVLEECREDNLKLSDFVLQNLVVHIALAIQRVKSGFSVPAIGTRLEKYSCERLVATRILKRVKEIIGIAFPDQEIDYITLHLISKRQMLHENFHVDNREFVKQDLLNSLSSLKIDDIYHFSSDFRLIEGVVTHLLTLKVRLLNEMGLSNPLLQEIKSQYEDVFYLTEKILNNMIFFSDVKLTDDEVAYVSLHFMAALERYKENTKFNVLAICATGFGAAQMLKNRLETEFNHRIHVVDVVGFYELTKDKLENIDFIVSAVDLSNLFFSIPVFKVSVFLKPNEVEEIKHAMDHMIQRNKSYHSYPAVRKSSEEKLELFFSESRFFILKTGKREDIEQLLIDSIAVDETIQFKKDFLNFLRDREKLSSVVFSDKIAVPHPIQAVGKQAKVAVAICKEEVEWDNVSNQIQIIFMISPSVYGNEELKLVTEKIIALTEKNEIQRELLHCKDFVTFITLLESL